MVWLADVIIEEGRLDEAGRLFDKAIALLRTRSDASDALSAALTGRGMMLYQQGKFEAAEPLFRQALAIDRTSRGATLTSVSGHCNNLAASLLSQKKYDEAIPQFKAAIAITKAQFGDDTADLATAYSNLSNVCERKEDYATALSYMKMADGIMSRHQDVLVDYLKHLNGYARLLRKAGQLEASERLIDEATTIVRAHFRGAPITTTAPDGTVASPNLDLASFNYVFEQSMLTHWFLEAREDRVDEVQAGAALLPAQDLMDTASARAMAMAEARLAAGSDRLAAIIREEQDLTAKIEAADEGIIAAYGTKNSDIVSKRSEQAVLRTKRDADAVQIDRDFPAYRALIDPKPIDLAEIRRYLAPDQALLVRASG